MKAKSVFISHGGGPLPLLGDPGHAEMVEALTELSTQLERPSAIVVVSAHWETENPQIINLSEPNLYYDYYNFPPESYEIKYDCVGNDTLATKIESDLVSHGFEVSFEHNRGIDHGVYVPLKIMYPEADIPVIQLSMLKNLDPETHIRMGQALQSLSESDVLVMGSGFSFHNMQAFRRQVPEHEQQLNLDFEAWLTQTCTDPAITELDRANRLINWIDAPGARYCHPREEHLLPLHVCYGVAESSANQARNMEILGKAASFFVW